MNSSLCILLLSVVMVTAVPKECHNYDDCKPINGSTCVKDPDKLVTKDNKTFCFCGDHSTPVNGKCRDVKKGPYHLCTADEDCVPGASCDPSKTVKGLKFCICTNNPEFYYHCASMSNTVSGLALVLMLASRIIY